MIVEKQIQVAQSLLATGLMDKVYVDVQLLKDDKGVRYPVYKQGAEQYYIGPDDTKGLFAYIRQTAPVSAQPEKIQGCSKDYKLISANRIVVFKDYEERNFESLLRLLLKPVFTQGITLNTINQNVFDLAQQESPLGDFAFDARTFYCAIDVLLSVPLNSAVCDNDTCSTIKNPVCL